MGLARMLALSALTWLAAPTQASAFCRASINTEPNAPCMEEDGVPLLFWDRGCFTYRFHRNVFDRLTLLTEPEIRTIFQRSFSTWETVDCGFVPFVAKQDDARAEGDWPAFVYDEPNEAVVTALTSAEWEQLEPPQPGNAFAITFLWHDTATGELLDVDIALNLGQGPFGDCGDAPCNDGTVDLENTITHEAGHTYGLGHSRTADATMFPDVRPGSIFMRDLDADDRAGLCALELPSHRCAGDDQDTSCDCPTPPAVSSTITRRSCACAVGPGAGRDTAAGALLAPLVVLGVAWRRRRSGRRSGT